MWLVGSMPAGGISAVVEPLRRRILESSRRRSRFEHRFVPPVALRRRRDSEKCGDLRVDGTARTLAHADRVDQNCSIWGGGEDGLVLGELLGVCNQECELAVGRGVLGAGPQTRQRGDETSSLGFRVGVDGGTLYDALRLVVQVVLAAGLPDEEAELTGKRPGVERFQ